MIEADAAGVAEVNSSCRKCVQLPCSCSDCSDSYFDTCRGTIGVIQSEAIIARTSALTIARMQSSIIKAEGKEDVLQYTIIRQLTFFSDRERYWLRGKASRKIVSGCVFCFL